MESEKRYIPQKTQASDNVRLPMLVTRQYLCHQKMKAMLTRDEIKKIEQHFAEQGMMFKQRLNELNISELNFYDARRMYSREDLVPPATIPVMRKAHNPHTTSLS